MTETIRDVEKVSKVTQDAEDALKIRFALVENNEDPDEVWREVYEIIPIVQDSTLDPSALHLEGTLPLQDQYGKPLGEQVVFKATYSQQALESLHVENLLPKDLEKSAEDVYYHPAIIKD